MRKPELVRLLSKWRERLRLEDWNITVRFATTQERKEEDWHGIVDPFDVAKSAEIVIVNPIYATDDDGKDAEVTIVHELLHLHMVPFRTKTNSLEEVAEENLVHILSTLLVALDRADDSVMGRKLSRRSSVARKRKKQVVAKD